MLEDATNQQLLTAWQDGNQNAATILVRRFMQRLVALVRSRLSRKLSRRLDPEDVVLSAWRSFFVAFETGRATVPAEDDLWPLLVTISLRKLSRQAHRHQAQSRDVMHEKVLFETEAWQQIVATDPTPAAAAVLADDVETLMRHLTPTEQAIVTRRLQGDDQASIAADLDCSTRTIKRALQRVRQLCIEFFADSSVSIEPIDSTDRENLRQHVTEAERVPTAFYTDFVLEQMVGQGRFGRVYRARRTSDGCLVAVKALKKSFWKDSRAVAAMHREHEIVATLSHPSIVPHLGWGVSPQGAIFLVMEWIEGESLRAALTDATLSISDTIQCGLQIGEALTMMHDSGVVHGDLTPGNILRRVDGAFVLTDFGFARWLATLQSNDSGGTPGFLAPEQISEDFGLISPRTDVYGLGATLYAMLTEKLPFQSDDVLENLARVLSAEPVRPPIELRPEIPDELNRILCDCLEKEPSQRPVNMHVVLRRLQTVQ